MLLSRNPFLAENDLPKILISGQQKCRMFISDFQHFVVRQPWRCFSDCPHVVPVHAKTINYWLVNAFVCHKFHVAATIG